MYYQKKKNNNNNSHVSGKVFPKPYLYMSTLLIEKVEKYLLFFTRITVPFFFTKAVYYILINTTY